MTTNTEVQQGGELPQDDLVFAANAAAVQMEHAKKLLKAAGFTLEGGTISGPYCAALESLNAALAQSAASVPAQEWQPTAEQFKDWCERHDMRADRGDHREMFDDAATLYLAAPVPAASVPAQPIDMVLYCPACGLQHIDASDERTEGWANPPHRSHLCHGCGYIWRPADVPTNGVAAVATKGSADTTPVPAASVPDATITLTGHQLRIAADFINPDGPGDRLQLDDELTFGVRKHQDDDGKVSTGMCCWNDDTDGVLPLDGEYEAASVPAQAVQPSVRILDDPTAVAKIQAKLKAAGMQAAPVPAASVPAQPALTVWEGAMPESNGKSNFTAVLTRKAGEGLLGMVDGYTIARSEYPGRVKYEADRVRYLIGELAERPRILDYDADTHSGYTAPVPAASEMTLNQIMDEAAKHKRALVPLHVTRAMQEVMDDEDWQWEDVLGAAEAITDEQYADIQAGPAASVPDAKLTALKLARAHLDWSLDGDEFRRIVKTIDAAILAAAAPQTTVKP